jgi:hypothetical protein
MPKRISKWVLIAVLATIVIAEPVNATRSTSLEAETMSQHSSFSKSFSDRTASGGRALLLFNNGTSTKGFEGSADRLIVGARGDFCGGAPHMVVKVDGTMVMSQAVQQKWTNYEASTKIFGGTHRVSVRFTNDYRRSSGCDRNLRLDKIDFVSATENKPAEFITRSGTGFVLNGEPFRFVGANMTNTAGDPSVHQCGPWLTDPEFQVDNWFARAREDFDGNVIRVWAYQAFTNSGTDWRGFERTVRLAEKYGFKIIPVLENQWPECTRGGYKYDGWYEGGYLKPYGGYSLSYKEYVRRVIERYKDEPTIAAWALMNEAESVTIDGEENPEALYNFARDMSSYVKSLDKNHLVTLGTIGAGQPGTRGADWERLHALETIDFTEFHDYGRNDEPMPGVPLEPSVALNTAVFTQDSGWNWTNGDYRRNKARVWETWTYEMPPADEPFRHVGLNFYGDFTGEVYVDEVRVGSKVYGFESGTEEGWRSSTPVTLKNADGVAYAGSRSLKLTFSQAKDARVWVPLSPEDVPGTRITAHVYVDDPGSIDHSNTLAAAMHRSKKLNKPIIVGEAGMTTCRSYEGSQVETPDSRARKFDAKMDVFFRAGGAGYLVWVWHPDSDCAHAFTTGDPLNAVLAKYAAASYPATN